VSVAIDRTSDRSVGEALVHALFENLLYNRPQRTIFSITMRLVYLIFLNGCYFTILFGEVVISPLLGVSLIQQRCCSRVDVLF